MNHPFQPFSGHGLSGEASADEYDPWPQKVVFHEPTQPVADIAIQFGPVIPLNSPAKDRFQDWLDKQP